MDSMTFDMYLQHLRDLTAAPTLFTRPDQIRAAMDRCKNYLSSRLRGYRVYTDAMNNLIGCPEQVDPERDLVYLSAHMDTVDADPKEWDPPYSPFCLYEDRNQMVARGVSDCKAGAAFQLFLAGLAGTGALSLSNLVFTLTFKEEGAGEKTACQIGKDLGTVLPLSGHTTFFLVLENTVTKSDPDVLSYYTSERGNFVIRITEPLDRLRRILDRLTHWNPVSIRPEPDTDIVWEQTLGQPGGHVCSVPREDNLLTRVIARSRDTDLIQAGSETGFSVVPPNINVSESTAPVPHRLVLSNRSFDSEAEVTAQLGGISYAAVKPFAISQGMDSDDRFRSHPVCRVFDTYRRPGFRLEKTYNIGVSDATIVSRTMSPAFGDRFIPVVLGPGTRSQRNRRNARLTHGKNETFDKAAGQSAVSFLLHLLTELGTVIPTTGPIA